jgi:hypothetical protein
MPQTICPKDTLIAEDNRLTQWGSTRLMYATECLSPEELHMGDGEPSPYLMAKKGEPPDEAWPEVFDDLFSQSGGLKCEVVVYTTDLNGHSRARTRLGLLGKGAEQGGSGQAGRR